jgi:ribonuclease E
MARTTSAVIEAAPVPEPATIERVERFTLERYVHAGETAAEALAPGSARRRALDQALRELGEGRTVPSTKWRRRYSLLLGLERLLSEDEPTLVDGTTLNPHQVDALSGTLTALLAAAQNGSAALAEDSLPTPVLAVDEEEPGDDADDDDEQRLDAELSELDLELDLDDEEDDAPEEEAPEPAAFEDFDEAPEDVDEDVAEGAADDPNAHKRFWFEHATGAGKTVAAMGFVEASRTGGILILTHRRNLVDQFLGELRTRGYAERESPALLDGAGQDTVGPVTVETYQWFVRNAGRISDAYTIVICDEAHTALGEKTSAAIRAWTGPIFIGMTATGALIARHVTDLFPTQTSRFDLAQAARRGVIAPLRCLRIPPGPGVRTIAKVPLRRGDVDVEFDQEMLAELLDQLPFNLAIADLYRTRFNGVPGVVYAAGVRHAYNVAEAFREVGIRAEGVSGETPKRELAEILARYEHGDIDVLVNAQLLAEGWNSPRATICMHLAPTASKRIYQQRVGRVTRRHQGKEAGVVVDFVHPATKHDDPVVTLHSLLDRDVYRGGAIVVGPVRRGRGRRVRVERRVIPVCADEERRHEVFERELWRIAVEHLDYGEQHMWAALAGARVAASGWRRARAMLHFDRSGELKRRFLLTAVERNKAAQLRLRALQEIAASRDAEAFDLSIDVIGGWSREERREAAKVMLQALAEKRIGRRDQANAWIWRMAEYTREVHEEYAVQRWPETKRLLGLLVNSSGGAHARNARRLVHSARKHDRRLSAALLAAAVAHTPEAEEVLRGARTRMARKPSALSRELLRNFPKGRRGRNRRRRKKGDPEAVTATPVEAGAAGVVGAGSAPEPPDAGDAPDTPNAIPAAEPVAAEAEEPGTVDAAAEVAAAADTLPKPKRRRARSRKAVAVAPDAPPAERADGRRVEETVSDEAAPTDAQPVERADAGQVEETETAEGAPKPAARQRRSRAKRAALPAEPAAAGQPGDADAPATTDRPGDAPAAKPAKPARARRSRAKATAPADQSDSASPDAGDAAAPDPSAPNGRPRAPRRRAPRASSRRAGADGPDERVVAEALRAEQNGDDAPLADDARERLEARVIDTLDDDPGAAAA